jgi:hypothetical protein
MNTVLFNPSGARVFGFWSRFSLMVLVIITVMLGLPGSSPVNAQGNLKFTFGVAPLVTETGNATLISVSFRDRWGDAFPSPGAQADLNLRGPSGWGEKQFSFTSEDGFINWSLDRPFRAGWYTLSGTVDGRRVSANVWSNGSLANALRPAQIWSVESFGNLYSSKAAQTVDVQWGRVIGAKRYLVRLLDADGDSITREWTSSTSISLEPFSGLNWFEDYTVQVFAFDLEEVIPAPNDMPERFNASFMTYTFTPYEAY